MLDLVLPILDDYQRRVLAEMAQRMMSSGAAKAAPPAASAAAPKPAQTP